MAQKSLLDYMHPKNVSKELINAVKTVTMDWAKKEILELRIIDYRTSNRVVIPEDSSYQCNIVDYDLESNLELSNEMIRNVCLFVEISQYSCELINCATSEKYIYTFSIASTWNPSILMANIENKKNKNI